MISVRPGTLGHRAITLIVARPGHYDAERLGQAIWRPRITCTADVLAVRRAIATSGKLWRHEASKLLQGLQRLDLIERCRAPMVSEEWAEEAAENPRAVVEAAASSAESYKPDTDLRTELLTRLVRHAPATVAEWVGARPSGNVQRAIADLVEWEVVVPGSRRWPTESGLAHVEALPAARGVAWG